MSIVYQNELWFIQHIGTFSDTGACWSRSELLRRYLDSCENRLNWEAMPRQKIIDFARHQLAVAASKGE